MQRAFVTPALKSASRDAIDVLTQQWSGSSISKQSGVDGQALRAWAVALTSERLPASGKGESGTDQRIDQYKTFQ